jgi:hypothetical protein
MTTASNVYPFPGPHTAADGTVLEEDWTRDLPRKKTGELKNIAPLIMILYDPVLVIDTGAGVDGISVGLSKVGCGCIPARRGVALGVG